MQLNHDKLLILDLDETLIYSSEKPLSQKYDFILEDFFVYKRPGVDQFISTCLNWFDLAVWTLSNSKYAHAIIERIFPDPTQLKFVFSQERCTVKFNHENGVSVIVKPLKKVKRQGFSLSKVIVIDDKAETFMHNYGNGIKVKEFVGNLEDDELFMLLKYLEMIKDVEDIRVIEKRRWRSAVLKDI